MKAAIYVRTSGGDAPQGRATMENQIAFCRAIALQHNLTVDVAHVFTDIDAPGDIPPTCWNDVETKPSRPALSALVEAITDGEVQRLIVHRFDRIATSSLLLGQFAEFVTVMGVRFVADARQLDPTDDPAERFAANLVRHLIDVDSELDRERRAALRTRKLQEIERTRARLARLEAEVRELAP